MIQLMHLTYPLSYLLPTYYCLCRSMQVNLHSNRLHSHPTNHQHNHQHNPVNNLQFDPVGNLVGNLRGIQQVINAIHNSFTLYFCDLICQDPHDILPLLILTPPNNAMNAPNIPSYLPTAYLLAMSM